LVQLSDDLLAQLDARAAREGRNRSELIREALAGYLHDDRQAELDRLIVAGYTRQPQTAEGLALADASARLLIAAEPWEPVRPAELGGWLEEAEQDIAAGHTRPLGEVMAELDEEERRGGDER
jgi:predicted transcriptional regulator